VDYLSDKQQEVVMTRYYFTIDQSNMVSFTDEEGEDFQTPEEAIKHALIVANELGRNNQTPVTVSVLREDRTLFGSVGANQFLTDTLANPEGHTSR